MAARHREPNATRRALLEAARERLAREGFHAVGVNAVIARAGLSKGTFYNWFSSGDDLLDAVAEDLLADAMTCLLESLSVPDTSVFQSFRALFDITRDWRMTRFGLADEGAPIHPLDPDSPLIARIEQRVEDEFAPVLADVLERGRSEGLMIVEQPEEMARLLLQLSSAVGTRNYRDCVQKESSMEILARVTGRICLFYQLAERMLGAPRGSLGLVAGDSRWLQALASLPKD